MGIVFNTLTVLGTADFEATYKGTADVVLSDQVDLLEFDSDFAVDVYVSFDGVNDHLQIRAQHVKRFELFNSDVNFPAGLEIFVRQKGTPLSGDFHIHSMIKEYSQ